MTPKEFQLISRLVERTRARRLLWEPTAVENQFALSLDSGLLIVEYEKRAPSKGLEESLLTDVYTLYIHDVDGRVLDTIENRTFKGKFSSAHSDAPPVQQLYDTVEQMSRDPDPHLDAFLKELA